RLIALQQVADLGAGAADAGDVWRGTERMAVLQPLDRLRCVAQGRAASAEGARHVLRRVHLELGRRAVELCALLVGLGRVELEADRGHGARRQLEWGEYIAPSR